MKKQINLEIKPSGVLGSLKFCGDAGFGIIPAVSSQ